MQSFVKFQTFFLSACLSFMVSVALAGDAIRSERIAFKKGADGTVIKNRIKGYETIDYLINAKANQRLMVVLETNNGGNYFNIMAPSKKEEAMHVGSTVGNRFEGPLPADGDYTIRVYLMRSAARRNESANYSLAVNVFGPGSTVAAPANDFADGFGGGPDYWQVTDVKAGDSLKLRAQPNTKAKVMAQLANGDILRNRGCKMAGQQRWCKVEQTAGKHLSGWVAGRYLREGAAPAEAKQENQDATLYSKDVKGNAPPFNATGEIPCSVTVGQPSRTCPFGVVRRGSGNADVWIKIAGTQERQIVFESGKPISSNSSAQLKVEKSGDLFLIRIGNEERYEIPEAVVFGG